LILHQEFLLLEIVLKHARIIVVLCLVLLLLSVVCWTRAYSILCNCICPCVHCPVNQASEPNSQSAAFLDTN